ncbi:MAG: SpoIID/LytB domain-containing protein [bacterium]
MSPLTRDERAIGGDVLVRVGIHCAPGDVEVGSTAGVLLFEDPAGRLLAAELPATETVRVECDGDGDTVRARSGIRGDVVQRAPTLRFESAADGRVVVAGRELRGRIAVSARAGSLFVANELPLEDYLRGVVPREIGRRPAAEREAVAAQAIAARTYTMRRLDQYGSLPFDVFGDVRDQVYEGVGGEDAVADEAIRETLGLVLADDRGRLLEAYYSSTCGGVRSDIEAVWPWRESHEALRGGPDGPPGAEWCRSSPHFRWTETWTAKRLNELVRENVPAVLTLPPGSVRGTLKSVRVLRRGPSGRAAEIEYCTTEGTWVVPGDRNRWILRRPDGGILRSVQIELESDPSEPPRIVAHGAGNGHGVGMCQHGAMGRARAGQDFRRILGDYYPGAEVRRLRGSDLPAGRSGAS